MRRGILFIFALPMMLAGFVMAAPAALAVSPHFVAASAAVNAAGSLTVNFKEAGLGDNVLINYEADANATATYVCVNNGGANPSAANKTTVSGPVSATGAFSSGKNGNVTASLTLSPPPRHHRQHSPARRARRARSSRRSVTRASASPTQPTASPSRSRAPSPRACSLAFAGRAASSRRLPPCQRTRPRLAAAGEKGVMR